MSPPMPFVSTSTLEAMRAGMNICAVSIATLVRHASAAAASTARGMPSLRMNARAKQKAERHVRADVDQHVFERDVARPRRREKVADLRGRRPPAAERLQAGIRDDQQVSYREYPREMQAARRAQRLPRGRCRSACPAP